MLSASSAPSVPSVRPACPFTKAAGSSRSSTSVMVGAVRDVMSWIVSSLSATTSGPSPGAHTRPTKQPPLPLKPVVSTSAASSLFDAAENRTNRP